MLVFETVNELSLRVVCRGTGVIFTRAGAFIAGSSAGQKNYTFEKVLLGPQNNVLQAALGSFMRRVSGENTPLMKVNMHGDSVTYYANYGRHVIVYKLDHGESISVESEDLLAFTADCSYQVRFLGQGVFSQKGLATTILTGNGSEAYVAVLSDGNPLVLSNVNTGEVLSVDPDAVICWIGQSGYNCDPQIKADVNWKTFIGQASGESYAFEWGSNQPVTVIVQPSERSGGISVSID